MVVIVDPGAPLPKDDVRQSVARELDAPAVAPEDVSPDMPAAGTLTVALDADGMLRVEYRRADGRMLFRTVAVPDDPAAALATVAFLAGNLARDPTDGLGAEMLPPVPAPPPDAPRSTADGAPAGAVDEEPASALTPASAVEREPASASDTASASRDGLGVGLVLSAVFDGGPTTDETVEQLHYDAEVELTYRLGWLRFGGAAFVRFGWVPFVVEADVGGSTVAQPSVSELLRFGYLALAAVALPIGPLELDLGAGVGLSHFAYQIDDTLGTRPHVRVWASLGVPLGDRFDLLVRVYGAETFDAARPVRGDATCCDTGPGSFAAGIGGRLRL